MSDRSGQDFRTVRRRERRGAFIAAFASSFSPELGPDAIIASLLRSGFAVDSPDDGEDPIIDRFSAELFTKTYENIVGLDTDIASCLRGWRLERLSKVALSVLRLAAAELKYYPRTDVRVCINEAVELCKAYGEEGDPRYVNGVLRTLSEKLRPDQPDAPPKADK